MHCYHSSQLTITYTDAGVRLCPRLVTRSEWGARNPVEESDSLPDLLPMMFVHHSSMEECWDLESCSQAVRDIQDLHIDGNGWWDIGYRSRQPHTKY